MSTEATIQSSIDSIDAQIAKLTEARETLVELLEGEGTENGSAVEEKPKRSRRSRTSDEDEKPARRSGRRPSDKRAAERKSSSRSTGGKSRRRNGDDEGTSKKDKIAAMLDEGMAPREIADELGIAPNYVYNVKRSL